MSNTINPATQARHDNTLVSCVHRSICPDHDCPHYEYHTATSDCRNSCVHFPGDDVETYCEPRYEVCYDGYIFDNKEQRYLTNEETDKLNLENI